MPPMAKEGYGGYVQNIKPLVPPAKITINNLTCSTISKVKIDEISQSKEIGAGSSVSFDVDDGRCSHAVHGESDAGLTWDSNFECKSPPSENFTVNWTTNNQASALGSLSEASVIMESGFNGYVRELKITSKLDCLIVTKIAVNRGNRKIVQANLPQVLKFGQTMSTMFFCDKILEVRVNSDQGEGVFTFEP